MPSLGPELVVVGSSWEVDKLEGLGWVVVEQGEVEHEAAGAQEVEGLVDRDEGM